MTFAHSHFAVTVKNAFKGALAWRGSMMLSLLTGPVYLLVQYLIWESVFSASATELIGGYTFEQMIRYFAFTSLTWYLVWDDTSAEISDDVHSGGFLIKLLRPVQQYRELFYKKIGDRALAVLIEFIPMMILFQLLFGISVFTNVDRLPYYLISVLFSFILYYEIGFLVGIISFYTTRNHGIRRIVIWLIPLFSGAYFPLTLLPDLLQKVFLLLPFSLVFYVPSQAYLGEVTLAGLTLSPFQLILYQLSYSLFLYVLIRIFYVKAVRRFSGVGA